MKKLFFMLGLMILSSASFASRNCELVFWKDGVPHNSATKRLNLSKCVKYATNLLHKNKGVKNLGITVAHEDLNDVIFIRLNFE
jgi:hypothetical protein